MLKTEKYIFKKMMAWKPYFSLKIITTYIAQNGRVVNKLLSSVKHVGLFFHFIFLKFPLSSIRS